MNINDYLTTGLGRLQTNLFQVDPNVAASMSPDELKGARNNALLHLGLGILAGNRNGNGLGRAALLGLSDAENSFGQQTGQAYLLNRQKAQDAEADQARVLQNAVATAPGLGRLATGLDTAMATPGTDNAANAWKSIIGNPTNVALLKGAGIDPATVTPDQLPALIQRMHQQSSLYSKPDPLREVGPGGTLVDTNTNKPVYTAPTPEKFGEPQAMVLNGKPVMASVGSNGTIRPVQGAAPYRAATSGAGELTDENDPGVIAWNQTVLDGNATMQQVPMKYRTAVARLQHDAPRQAYSPLAVQRYTLGAQRLAKNYVDLPQYQLTANGLPYLQRIDAALKVPGSVSDQDLLDSLTKLNTAGNAITDAQVKIITDGKSFSDAMGVFANKLGNGGVLSDNQRQQIQKIAKGIYANYQKGYQPVYDKVAANMKLAGIPEQFWGVPDLNNLSAQAEAAPPTPAPTGAKMPALSNSKGWALHVDAAGNRAYVSPDGKHYEMAQ